jgi:signal transduction histidine kinase
VLIVALMFNLSAPRRLAAIFVLTVHVPAVWLLALAHAYDVVPGLVPFPGFATASIPAFGAFLAAFGYTLFFLGAVTLGQWIRGTLDAAVEERVAEQQRLLELHRDTARTMSSLSAEIAHELKNPLASIKGLAGLLRRDVDGAGKERLEVMRGEIDRMQAILEEFLHYSRPVVPLELRATSLRSLAQEVLALHEGMALTRDVALELSETDVVATCDPRKVRQILVNVVQNAIEASPARGLVRLALSTRGREVIVDVEDQGSGLDPEVRGSLFEVGATTKPKGSGIGLAVARGLARQHEGELTLEDREGGGCRARLVLPIDGPHVEPSAETATTPATEVASSRASRAPSAAAVSHTVRAEELSP